MKVDIRYNKSMVDWININYPERTWILQEGPVGYLVQFDSELPILNGIPAIPNKELLVETLALGSKFDEDISLFFEGTEDAVKQLIIKVCEHLIDITKKEDIIYLYTLLGCLVYTGDTTIYANWIIRLYIDKGGAKC